MTEEHKGSPAVGAVGVAAAAAAADTAALAVASSPRAFATPSACCGLYVPVVWEDR